MRFSDNLKDLTVYINRGITPKYTDISTCIVINQKCIREIYIDLKQARRHDIKNKVVSKDKRLRKHDIVVNSTGVGTLGRLSIIRTELDNLTCDSHVTIVRPDITKINPRYLGYYLFWKKDVIEGMARGSTGQTELSRIDLGNILIEYPEDFQQQKIANILSSLDDKIELNNKINRNLEELAQTLYKRWFVDFEFPNEDGEPYKSSGGEMVESELGLIPKGWFVKEQGEYFPVITGKKNANVATFNGKYKFFTCSQQVYLTDNYSFEGDAILVAGNGDFNVKYYSGKFEAYQRTYVLIPHNKKLSGILYFAIQYNLNDITSGSRGSVISFITKGHIENFKVVFPNTITLEKLGNIFKNILISIANNKEENDRLSKLRDELLPKLMNGEIEVPIEE